MRIGWIAVLTLTGCATAQPRVSDAITDWGARTGWNVIMPACKEVRRPARSVNLADEELERLLAGTKLTYEVINSRTIAIICPDT